MAVIAVVLAGLVPMLPAIIFGALSQRRRAPAEAVRGAVLGLTVFNAVLILIGIGAGLVWLAFPSITAFAVGPEPQGTAGDQYASLATAILTGLSAIGAGISIAGAAIGAGVAVGGTGAAAIGAIAEKPESLGRALIFVGLAEGIAIYGLIISFMILSGAGQR
jgi:V/A-type H+-transporting ATPase subunit K